MLAVMPIKSGLRSYGGLRLKCFKFHRPCGRFMFNYVDFCHDLAKQTSLMAFAGKQSFFAVLRVD